MQQASTNDPLYFLPVNGEMATLTRQKDWSGTPVGPPDTWPQSLRTLLSLMLRSRFPMFLFWGPELICFYNDAYRPSLGNDGKHPAALGEPGETVWPEIWSTIKPLIDQVMRGGEATWSEDQLIPIYRNGRIEDVYWTFSYSPAVNEAGEVAGVFVTCTETTQAVEDRRRLAHSEARFQRLIAQAPVAVALFSGPQFVITLANEQVLEYWGRSREQVMHKPLFEALPEAAGQGFEELLTGVYTTGERFVAKELTVTLERNGRLEPTYIDFVYEPFYESDGQISGVMVICIEITEQVLARRRIEENEYLLQSIFEQAPTAIALFNGPDFVIERANPLVCQLWGLSREQAINKPLFKALPEAAGQGYEELLSGVLQTGEPFVGHELPTTFRRNGRLETAYFDFVYHPYANPDGKVDRIILVAGEVTQRMLDRQKLEESEMRFRLMANSLSLMIWVADAQGHVEFLNQQWVDYCGIPFETKSASQVAAESLHPDDGPKVMAAFAEAMRTGQPFEVEQRNRSATGEYRWFLNRAKPYHDPQTGKVIRWFGAGTDIHDRKLAEEALQASETRYRQLAAQLEERVKQRTQDLERSNLDLMQFASVASHDLKEPLRKVQIFGTRLQDLLAGRLNEEETDLFTRLVNSTARMQTLVSAVLRFSKLSGQTDRLELVDMNAVVDQIREDLEVAIREQGASVIHNQLPTVWAAPEQMHQLFANLIGNGLKFHDGQAPVVRIEPVPLTDELAHEMNLPTKQYIVVAVSDNGIGFDPKYNYRIFGMFQRLHGKSQFPGTGIGLTIVKKIVDNHGGYIDVQSRPGQGTTFRVALPLSPPAN